MNVFMNYYESFQIRHHCTSNARVKYPKQKGHAMAVRHLTGRKQLVVLLNRMGHSSSYEELLAVDTSLSTEVLTKVETYGTVITSLLDPSFNLLLIITI